MGALPIIAETGFLQGELIIPKFIIQELQYIADSPDPREKNTWQKRTRHHKQDAE